MKRTVVTLGLLLGAILASGPASAMSISLADTFYPTYGQARHFSQAFEYLGTNGSACDGVTFSQPVVAGSTVHVTTATTVVKPAGEYEWMGVWIDWNSDRVWDLSERAIYLEDTWFDSGLTSRGFDIPVPVAAVVGTTWMRVRYTYDGPLDAVGDLYTGEVEDYSLSIGGSTGEVPEPTTAAMMLVVFGALAVGTGRLRRKG
jgi:hypothetical protein